MKYSITNNDHKFYFAGFFNSAINNFDLTLLELSKRANKNPDKKNLKATIKTIFNEKTSKSDVLNYQKYISESIPVANQILNFIKNTNSNIAYSQFLLDLYISLDAYRNYYTHHAHDPITIQPYIVEFINSIMLQSALSTNKRRLKTPQVELMVTSNDEYKTIIDDLFKKENSYLDSINKKRIKAIDKYNFAINRIFKRFYFYPNNRNPNEDNKPILKLICGQDNALNEDGVFLLLNIFLEKRQSQALYVNVELHPENTNGLQQKIYQWTFTHYAYKPIKYLYHSDYSNDSLLLQMVSELSKCPRQLYPLLGDSKKLEFFKGVNTYLRHPDNQDDNEEITHYVLRKRYENKFPYFVIRFLDAVMNFENLRFHVNVGKFHHDTTEKIFKATGTKRDRLILENFSVMEKLEKVTDKKNNYISKLEKNSTSYNKDWVEHPRPKYQFFENNIGIWLKINRVEITSDAPEKRDRDESKYDILNKMGLENDLKKPIAYLSFNELPALLYALLVEGRTESEVESIITEAIHKHLNTIGKLKETDDFAKNRSRELKRYANKLSQTEYDYVGMKKIVEYELNIDPLKEIRQYYKTVPKNPNEFSNTEKGKIANWLALDMKRFTKPNIKKNWKGYQFSEYQALLSFYDSNAGRVSRFLNNELNISENGNQLMFNGIDFEKKTLYAFYKHYMEQRNVHLKNLSIRMQNIIDADTNGEKIHKRVFFKQNELFLNLNKYKIPKLTDYKEKLKTNTLMLPRGIFDAKPTATKDNNGDFTPADWFSFANKSEKQAFYNYPKYYPYWSGDYELKQTIESNKGLKVQYQDNLSESIQRDIYKTEKSLRKEARQDHYILEMIKWYITKNAEIENKVVEDINLKKFYSNETTEEHALSENILTTRIKIKLAGGLITGDVALKDLGKYKKLSKDQRVLNLLSYNLKEEWTIDEILEELDDYENIRSNEFFKHVHALEKIIYEHAISKNDYDELLQNGYPNFKHYMAYLYIKNEEDKSFIKNLRLEAEAVENIKEELKVIFMIVLIRNKFAHNQLMPKIAFNYMLNEFERLENEHIGTYMNRVFINLKKSLNDK